MTDTRELPAVFVELRSRRPAPAEPTGGGPTAGNSVGREPDDQAAPERSATVHCRIAAQYVE